MKKIKQPALAADELPADTYLSPADHVATVLADKDAAVASLEVQRDTARLHAYKAQAAAQIEQAERALAEKRSAADAANAARKRLAEDVAQRYAIDWKDVALEPITGQLIAVAKG